MENKNIESDDEFMAGWNSQDVSRSLAVLDENIVWYDVASAEPFRGKEAVAQYM